MVRHTVPPPHVFPQQGAPQRRAQMPAYSRDGLAPLPLWVRASGWDGQGWGGRHMDGGCTVVVASDTFSGLNVNLAVRAAI